MADVFISYAHQDRDWVKDLAAKLEAESLSVWWDTDLLPGSKFRAFIKQELEQAKAVIVVWSRSSLESDWVQDEADDARQRGLLVPVLKDAIKPPHGFRQIRSADLSQWRGQADHPEFRRVIDASRAFRLRHSVSTDRVTPGVKPYFEVANSPRIVGNPKFVIIYSHQDKDWFVNFRTSLGRIQRIGFEFVFCNDKDLAQSLRLDVRLDSGAWRGEIGVLLHSAKFAVLLVSQAFLNSKFLDVDVELPNLLKAAQRNGTRIFRIPIKPSSVAMTHQEITEFPSLHSGGVLSTLARMEQDAALHEIESKLLAAI